MIGAFPMDRVANLNDRIQGLIPPFLQRLTPLQQVVAGAGALGAVALGTALVIWSQQPEYAQLYTGLAPEDAGAVTARLRDARVPYQLSDGGSTILVPKNQVYDERLTMASQGLPTGGRVGFEIFDRNSFGMPEFVQKLNFQRALEGELERTIGKMAGVDSARVHLVMPKTELFTEAQRETTASVSLKLVPNTRIQATQTAAIRHLVASSVAGLQAKNVVIADTAGNLLEDAKSDASTGALTTQLDAKRSYERGVEQAVTALLEQTLGPEKAVVRANALMNWDQIEAQSETFSPAGAAPQPRSSRQTQETFTGQGPPPEGGVPGATTNVPPVYTGAGGAQGPTDYSRQDVTTNYELSKLTEKRTPAFGTVQRLSVAVMVPDKIMINGQLVEMPQAQLDKLSTLVASAAGIDTARGDTVSVAPLPLDTSKQDTADQAEKDRQQHELEMTGLKIGGALLAILIFFLGLRFMGGGMGRRGAASTVIVEGDRPIVPPPLPVEGALQGGTAEQQAAMAAAMAAGGSGVTLGLPMSMEEQRRVEEERIRQENEDRAEEQRALQIDQLRELAKTDPQRVAEVLQIWMAEDRRAR